MRNAIAITLILAAAGVSGSWAQSTRTEHTLKLDDPMNRPKATIEDVAWLAGSWTGEVFGSRFEEVWSQPSAGTMMGMYKVLGEDGVSFYELEMIVEVEGSLEMRVKHFSADFTAWEEKAEYLSFPLVKVDEDQIFFQGLTFERLDRNRATAYLVVSSGDSVREEVIDYRRTSAAE